MSQNSANWFEITNFVSSFYMNCNVDLPYFLKTMSKLFQFL